MKAVCFIQELDCAWFLAQKLKAASLVDSVCDLKPAAQILMSPL